MTEKIDKLDYFYFHIVYESLLFYQKADIIINAQISENKNFNQ